MIDIAPFALQHSEYFVAQLARTDINRLQALFEKCSDFFVMTNGVPAASTAARAEFEEVPEGKPLKIFRRLGCLLTIFWWVRLLLSSTILTNKRGGLA